MNVVITRPASQATALEALIRSKQPACKTLIYPAIAIEAVADPAPLDAALAHLQDYRLVVFVSPNAIEYALARLQAAWPAQVELAAMGPGSLAALAARGLAAPDHVVHAPPGHQEVENPRFDSEALLAQLDLARLRDAHVLIVKGNGGRPWLAQQLAAAGALVDLVESYHRYIPQPEPQQQAALLRLIESGTKAAVVVTSSEGLSNLLVMLDQLSGTKARNWLQQCRILVPHARIVENATAAGLTGILLTGPGDENMARALEWERF